jgi:hypothetical protein
MTVSRLTHLTMKLAFVGLMLSTIQAAGAQQSNGAVRNTNRRALGRLRIENKGTGRGDVTSFDGTIHCESVCNTDNSGRVSVGFIATPAEGSIFDGWLGACHGKQVCRVKSNTVQTVQAHFSLIAAQAPAGSWQPGDLHVHDEHSPDGSTPRQRNHDKAKGNVSIADQIGQAASAGLKFLPLTDHRTYDQHYDPLWESSTLLLLRGEEANLKPHSVVLGASDSIVQGAARADRVAFAHVQQSLWDAHSQDAVWSIAHPTDGEVNADGSLTPFANLQGVDLVELWNRASRVDKLIDYSENRWNAGFRFGVAGVSDSHSRELWKIAGPGTPSSQVFTSQLNERGVLDGLRAGHTSISSSAAGPLLILSTDLKGGGFSAIGGDEVIVPAGTKGYLRIRAQRAEGLQLLVYRTPGRSAGTFKTFTPTQREETFTFAITTSNQADWYRVEARTASISESASIGKDELKAAASPIFISPSPVEARPATAIPTDQGTDDGAVWVSGARGAFTGFPDVSSDAGVLHTVMESHSLGASRIVYRRRNADGKWSYPTTTLSGAGLAQYPRIVAKGADVWVVWQEDIRQIPHRPEIHLRHSVDGGKTWRPVQIVRALEGRAEHPTLALTLSGTPILAWQEIQAATAFDVMVQEIGKDIVPRNLSHEGKTIFAGTPDDTRSPRYPASVWPSVTVSPGGLVAVTWQDNRTDPDPLWTGSSAGKGTDPDNWQIMVAVRDQTGTWKAPMSLGADDTADRHPAALFNKSGDLVVAWESKGLRPSGMNLSIQTAISSDGGVSFSSSTPLAQDTQAMSQHIRLGLDPDGAVRAVWFDSRSADWRWRIMTATFLHGSGWNAGTLFSGRGNNTWPATAGGAIIFASSREAERLQRDHTQQVFLIRSQ